MRVLVIEDDASLNEIVCAFLASEGYRCTPAFSGSEARMLIEGAPGGGAGSGALAFDLVVTDLMLPGCPGEDLVALARERLGNVPVIVTSAKGAVSDRVALLRTGADDYLVKPFDLEELLARIDAQLRIRGAGAAVPGPAGAAPGGADPVPRADGSLRFGGWLLSPRTRSFTVEGVEVHLTRTEFDLLATLMAHPDRVFTKRDLYLAAAHGAGLLADLAAGAANVTSSDEKSIATHMGNLRAKLRAAGSRDDIETVWGIGFKLRSRRPEGDDVGGL